MAKGRKGGRGRRSSGPIPRISTPSEAGGGEGREGPSEMTRLRRELQEAHGAKLRAEKARDEAENKLAETEQRASNAEKAVLQQKARVTERLRPLEEDLEAWTRAERESRLAKLNKELDAVRGRAQSEIDERIKAAEGRARALEEAAEGRVHTQEAELSERVDRLLRDASERSSKRLEEAQERLGKADAEAGALREEAHRALADARRTAEATLSSRVEELEVREEASRSEAQALKAQRRELARRESDLEADDRELRVDRASLVEARRAFEERSAELGPAAVERLQLECSALKERLQSAREFHAHAEDERRRLASELEAVVDGKAPRLAEVERLRADLRAARDELGTRPDEAQLETWKAKARDYADLRDQLAASIQELTDLRAAQDQADEVVQRARREVARLERSKSEAATAYAELEAERDGLLLTQQQAERAARELETLQIQRDADAAHVAHLTRQLEAYTRSATGVAASRFGRLAVLTEDVTSDLGPSHEAPPLPQLVEDARGAMAAGVGKDLRPFYYDHHTVRTFLAGVAAADLTLLQGPSGTGKTSLPLAFGEVIGADVVRVPVQAGWRDRTDLLGYYNAFTQSFRTTRFTEAVYRAGLPDYQDRPVFIVLDECNLSQVEYYFADLLSELEDWSQETTIRLFDEQVDGVAPPLLAGGRALRLPRNIRYFGTANQDETTCGIADKTYDRSSVLLLEKRAQPDGEGKRRRHTLTWSSLETRFDEACEAPGYDRTDLNDFVSELETRYMEDFGFGLGNRFEDRVLGRFLPVYVAAGGEPGEGLDHIIRSRIVRRLERMRDPGVRPALRRLDELFTTLWPFTSDASRSRAALERLIQRISA